MHKFDFNILLGSNYSKEKTQTSLFLLKKYYYSEMHLHHKSRKSYSRCFSSSKKEQLQYCDENSFCYD
jgi:hypothetical protein